MTSDGALHERVAVRDKIVPFDALPALRQRFRDKRIVQCHGAFDLVHMGHILHFEEARALGDVLVVTITADQHIRKKRAVTFGEDDRARQVAALEIVDFVSIVPEPSALSAIERLQPDVYVKGPEYANLAFDKSRSIYHETRALERFGGRIHFTSGETFSSTKLAHFLLNSPEAAQDNPLLRNDRVLFKDISSFGFRLEDLKAFLAAASRLRVCVVGETIIDEWVDVSLTNLSTQSRCLSGVETARVTQVGGAGIIAKHLTALVGEVQCVTNGGGEVLEPEVRVRTIAPGRLVETRFVDRESGRPVFKTRSAGSLAPEERLPDFTEFDLVLVADYGHGLVDAAEVNDRLRRPHGTVAAMAQVNSGNYGYNLPAKYAGADYYSVNRTEAELCIHERGLPVDSLAGRLANALGATALAVTDGDQGAFVRTADGTAALPALSVSPVDTIGCGDAFFAFGAVAARLGLPAREIALVGSIAAAAMAQRRCNERAVTEEEFLTIGKIVI